MSINIYQTLLESYDSENLKKTLQNNLTRFQELTDKYINEDDEDEYSSTLGLMLSNLNNVVKIFNSMRIYL